MGWSRSAICAVDVSGQNILAAQTLTDLHQIGIELERISNPDRSVAVAVDAIALHVS